jgi:hypothetical protein
LGTLYVEDSRAAKRNEVFRISNDHHEEQGSLESSWHFERPRQPFGNARRTRASVGVSLVVSLARGKKCFKRSGAQVDFLSFAEHDLQESDGKSKSAKSCAKDLAKDESSTWTRNRRSAADEETSLGIQIREIGCFLEQKINPERII